MGAAQPETEAAATVNLNPQCDPDGIAYTITNDGDTEISWTLTGAAGDTTIDEEGTLDAEDDADKVLALNEGEQYTLTLEAFDGDTRLANQHISGTLDRDNGEQPETETDEVLDEDLDLEPGPGEDPPAERQEVTVLAEVEERPADDVEVAAEVEELPRPVSSATRSCCWGCC